MANTKGYQVGDIIEYFPHGADSPRRVRVTARSAETGNNYQPGFDGVLLGPVLPGLAVWGYDSQIVRVVDEGVALLDRMMARGYDPARD